jgi:hypothetical protein
MRPALALPAALLLLGAYLIVSSLAAREHVVLFGGALEAPAKFATLFGAIGIFGGLIIGLNLLFAKSPQQRASAPPVVGRDADRNRPPGKS